MVKALGVQAGDLPRNTCPKCETEYDGISCPACGLKFRPRCPDCGARLAWMENIRSCEACGCPTPDKVFFVPTQTAN